MRALALALRAGAAALAMVAIAASAAEPTDISVKAAFLPRFARYVTWPASALPKAGGPYQLCVIGSDPFGSLLDQTAASQTVDGRKILVRRLNSASGAEECQIAFVANNRLGELNGMDGKPVLTVTDGPAGSPRGIIHFAIVGGRVRFFIDQASAQQRRLGISSRLLALALGVRR
ncbi:MAG: YfiR family protein [Sphingomonas sp.]|nr:YfiR family protein [Sphingomonas sp.]